MEEIKPIFVTPAVKRKEIADKTLETIQKVFPFENDRYRLEVDDLAIEPGKANPAKIKEAVLKARTLSQPVRATLILRDKKTGKVIQKLPKYNLLQLPTFTQMHTFIIRGNPYNISNQLRMRPGVYTRKKKNEELEAIFNLSKGENFRLSMDPKTGHFKINVGNSAIPLYPVLRKMGVPDKKIEHFWNPKLVEKNKATYYKNPDKYVKKLYENFVRTYERKPGEDPAEALKEVFDKTEMDPEITKKTLGKPFKKVDPNVLLETSKRLLHIYKTGKDFDERDNLAFKHIKSVDDFFAERIDLEARALRRKFLQKLERNPDLKKLPKSPFTKTIYNFVSTSALSQNPTQINPIEIFDHATMITSLGEGGISSTRAITDDARALHTSHLAVLDPIRTPESDRIGVNLRTTLFASRDKNGRIYTVLRDAKKKKNVLVPIDELDRKHIAFPTPGEFPYGKRDKVDAVYGDRIYSVPATKIDYVVPNAQWMYSVASQFIPFMESIDGNRQTMGSKMMTQALPLENAEPPLVRAESYLGNGESSASLFGEFTTKTSPVSGVVKKVTRDKIVIAPEKSKQAAEDASVELFRDLPLASKTFFDQQPKVKPGDRVREGQVIAETPFSKNGVLSLGVNLNTAYLPYRGLNSNDAVVISESAAKKLTSLHMYRFGVDLDVNSLVNPIKHQAYFKNKYLPENYNKLDADGVAKPGSKVRKGDILIAALRKSTLSPEAEMLGKLHKSLVKPYHDIAVVWEREEEGEVIDVAKSGNKIRLTIKTKQPARIGDKISGSYGNKGVISAIVPDSEMVRDESGNPVDLAVSSAVVVSRINPAQIIETAVAKVAKKTGKPVVVRNFSGKDNVKWAKELLKKHSVRDKETVFDPVTGKKIKNVFVGPQYTLKLFKSTDTNFSARGVEDYDVDQQPSAGGTHGSKSMGRLVFNALIAHDARNVLKEASIIKSQKNDNWWRAYQLGQPLPPLNTTFAYDKFGTMLAGAGIKMNKSDDQITLAPLTDKDTTQMSAGKIEKPLFVRAKDLRPEAGGLFDPVKTGGPSGTKWAHIELKEPMINPLFERPVKILSGLRDRELKEAIKSKGTVSLREEFSRLDLNAKEKELLDRIPRLKGAERDQAIKALKYIKGLKENNIRPEDAYFVKKIPVIPPVFRPIIPGARGDLQVSDANYLYRDLMLANEMLDKTKGIPEAQADARVHLYDTVKAVYGLGSPVSPQLQARKVRGFIDRIAGTSPKQGFFQKKLIKKRLDLTGRGTIAPDPSIGLDEIGIPEEMAWRMYQPFLVRQLVQRGYKVFDAKKMIEEKHPLAQEILKQELKDRPILVNRAPSLYRYNVIAAYPKLVSGKTIRVHEFLAPLQAGDFDGDAVQIHVPVTDEARMEARRMTLPNMLLSDQEKGTLTKAAPQQEAVAGLYLATSKKPSGKKRVFDTKADAMAAYHRGEISLSTPVEIRK